MRSGSDSAKLLQMPHEDRVTLRSLRSQNDGNKSNFFALRLHFEARTTATKGLGFRGLRFRV